MKRASVAVDLVGLGSLFLSPFLLEFSPFQRLNGVHESVKSDYELGSCDADTNRLISLKK